MLHMHVFTTTATLTATAATTARDFRKIIFQESKQGDAFFLYLVHMCNPLFPVRLCNESYKVESTRHTQKIH